MIASGIRPVALALVLALAASATPQLEQARRAGNPKLLVIVVVDQMRFDYLERVAKIAQRGLKRLITEGAVFERAAYPYATTVTCAGHATISTGTIPATHGIVSNEWWSRAEGRQVLCTDDASAISVPYIGAPEKMGHSARRLRVPTLGDRLGRVNRDARVVTLSVKPRSAIMLAGQSGIATWFVDATHGWATSSAYTSKPIAEVHAFVTANPIERDRQAVWNPLNASSFAGLDNAPGERPKRGWTASFPHPLAGAPGTPETQFYELWRCSPYSNQYLIAMAVAQAQSLRLGQRDAVDLLGIGLSGLDCVGHDFGPDSAEVHDTVLRLDQVLGTLFDALDQAVGRDRYVVVLSSDHGVSPIPEQRQRQSADAGRVLAPEVRRIAEAAMVAAHGAGPHIAAVIPPYIYFTPATRALVEKSPEAARPVIDAVSRMSGVVRVLSLRGFESKLGSSDPLERAAALSYYASESGELLYLLKAEWINGDSSAATHGSPHDYDRRVPLVLMGGKFKPGRYSSEASPADIAPTLASMIGLKLSPVDGKILKAAIR